MDEEGDICPRSHGLQVPKSWPTLLPHALAFPSWTWFKGFGLLRTDNKGQLKSGVAGRLLRKVFQKQGWTERPFQACGAGAQSSSCLCFSGNSEISSIPQPLLAPVGHNCKSAHPSVSASVPTLRTPCPHLGRMCWPSSLLLRLLFMHLACIPSGIIDGVASEAQFEAVFPTSRAGTEQGEIYLCCSIAIEPQSCMFYILQDSELLVTGSIQTEAGYFTRDTITQTLGEAYCRLVTMYAELCPHVVTGTGRMETQSMAQDQGSHSALNLRPLSR